MNIPASWGSATKVASSFSASDGVAGGTGLESAMRTGVRDRVSTRARGPSLQLTRQLPERQHCIRQAGARDEARHLPDDACGLVLHEHAATGARNLLASAETVLPHSSQHERQPAWSVGLGDGAKQHVRRRPMRVLLRLLIENTAARSI